MFNDAVDLWDFYGTSLGKVARRLVRRKILTIWPDLRGLSMVGLGYATPYMRPFRDSATRAIAVMPAQQGVLHWPREGANLALLADEAELPLEDMSVDRVLLVHAVECTEQLRAMLSEVWRVLNGDGRVLVVVPNRRGLWARFERTPFGHGHPYSPAQLSRLLRDSLFTPTRTVHALFMPPWQSRLIMRSAFAIEEVGERWFTRFAGVVMIEASKQIYARPRPKLVTARARTFLPVPARQTPAMPITAASLQHLKGANPCSSSP
jgi:SAM-dependent methyltransferase